MTQVRQETCFQLGPQDAGLLLLKAVAQPCPSLGLPETEPELGTCTASLLGVRQGSEKDNKGFVHERFTTVGSRGPSHWARWARQGGVHLKVRGRRPTHASGCLHVLDCLRAFSAYAQDRSKGMEPLPSGAACNQAGQELGVHGSASGSLGGTTLRHAPPRSDPLTVEGTPATG